MSINSHFVSRFLTQPWEHGQRMLWYYDFDDNRIRSQSSRSLFATKGANSADVELRLNQLVESPIAGARSQFEGARCRSLSNALLGVRGRRRADRLE
jgi:hypothetical protein